MSSVLGSVPCMLPGCMSHAASGVFDELRVLPRPPSEASLGQRETWSDSSLALEPPVISGCLGAAAQ